MPKLPGLDGLRARVGAGLGKLPGKAGELARRANDALGRPFAEAAELADRRAFADKAPAAAPAAKPAPVAAVREAAPVLVYHKDKQRSDLSKLTDILDVAGIPYKVMNIESDPAAQYAVQRDSKGFRLPVVFIAGECFGGRTEIVNMSTTGELAKKVFG